MLATHTHPHPQEEGIPMDLGDFEPVPGIMEKPQPQPQAQQAPPRPRANEYGVVFPGALEQSEAESQAFLRAFKQTQRGRDAALPSVEAWAWWQMRPEAQRAWLAEAAAQARRDQAAAAAATGRGAAVAAPPPPSSSSAAAPALVFKLRGRLLGPTRVRYDATRGRFALAETPWLERTWPLRALPSLIRYPLTLARPLYAPLFCLRWLALRTLVLWRALRQFVLPSWPYLFLFTARAAYLLAACMLLTVAVDELLKPLAQGAYEALARLTGRGGAGLVLPDFRGYSLRPGGVGGEGGAEQAARTWVERWAGGGVGPVGAE